MRAALYNEFAGPITVDSLPDPAPPSDGVVIRVVASGICRSDWHGWQGHDPDIRSFPHVPGHELAGEVVAVGSSVERWRGGERVTTPFVCGCGECAPCRRGAQQVCDNQTQPGFTHWGSHAELVVIRNADINLVAIPESVTASTAASLGCRFATSFRAVVDQGAVTEGEWVAVHGCGGVGLSAVMIAAAHGARVIAVDIDDASLERARELGAEVAINGSAGTDVVAEVVELTSGGADLSLDALGATTTATNSIRSLRKNGRHVQVGLLAGDDFRPPLPMELVIGRELTLIGSHGMAAHQYPRMMAMIAEGRLDPARLISRLVDLDEVPEELMSMGQRSSQGMVVMTIGASE